MNFDCKVCEGCGVAMTAAEYHSHPCPGASLRGPTNGQAAAAPANVIMDTAGAIQPRRGVNGIGMPLDKLRQSTGRPKGARNINAKHPSSLAKRFKSAGLDWAADFALAIKGNKRERIRMWLRLLPYMVTTTNRVRVKKWKGKASRAAIIALNALEGK